MTPDELHRFHFNAVCKLDDPKLGERAAQALCEIQAEFTRRASSESRQFIPMLACMVYNVRWRGWKIDGRRRLIDWIVACELPQINSPRFMEEWGTPGSLTRIRQFGKTIRIYLDKYAKQPLMEVAVARWKADLEYLREVFREHKVRLAIEAASNVESRIPVEGDRSLGKSDVTEPEP